LNLTPLVIGAVVLTAGALSVVSCLYAHRTLRREIHARRWQSARKTRILNFWK
jgi:hypothetical protein